MAEDIKKMAEDVYFLQKSGVVLEFSEGTKSGSAPSRGKPWAAWYKPDNIEPDKILQVLLKNNINPGIIYTICDFIIGKGVITYKEVLEDGKKKVMLVQDPEVSAWLKKNRINHYMRKSVVDLKFFGNTFSQLIMNTLHDRVAELHHVDASSVRAEQLQDGHEQPLAYYLCGEWQKAKYVPGDEKNSNVMRLPAWSEEHAGAFGRFIYHGKRYVPGQPYYSPPDWYGNMDWIRLANRIPLWHLSNIDNGFVLRYHVKIPKSYFDQFPPEQREGKERQMREDMSSWLAGAENVGKAFVSRYGNNGSLPDEWKIESITTDLKDAAFTAIYQQSNSAMTSGHGISPVLAGIEMAGKLSSGSELRLAYNMFMSLKTQHYREILLEPLQIVQQLNGWDPALKFGFENIEMTTLDENPTGQQHAIV